VPRGKERGIGALERRGVRGFADKKLCVDDSGSSSHKPPKLFALEVIFYSSSRLETRIKESYSLASPLVANQ